MAKKRRPSPTGDDLERISESLRNTYVITDFNSFDVAWMDYFEDNGEMREKEDLKIKTFNIFAENYPSRLFDTTIPKKELKGKERKRVKKVFRQLDIVGIQKGKKEKVAGKIVYVSKEFIVVRGKNVVRYRDKKGRFASVKK